MQEFKSIGKCCQSISTIIITSGICLIGLPGLADNISSDYRVESHMQGGNPGQDLISKFSQLVKAAPSDPVANYNLASCYFVNNEIDKAIQHFTNAIQSKSQQVLAPSYVGRGGCYIKLGRLESARQDLSTAIAMGGPAALSALAYSDRGTCYVMMNQAQKSIADFTKAIELDPVHMADPLSNRATAYLILSDYEHAVADSTECLNKYPKTVRAYVARAEAYRRTKQFDLAIADCDKGLSVAPNSSMLLINRASAYRGAGQFEKALADADKAIALNPKEPMGFANRGEANRKLDHIDEAISDLSKALSMDPSLGLVYHYRSLAYASAGNSELSAKDQESALKNGFRTEDDDSDSTAIGPLRAS